MLTVDLSTPYLESAIEMFSIFYGFEASVIHQPGFDGTTISGIITIRGDIQSQMAMTIQHEVAVELVAEMLAMTPDEVDDEILSDGVGEMVNIIAGNAKSKEPAFGGEAVLSIPTVIKGMHQEITMHQGRTLSSVGLGTELGPCVLTVWVRD